MVTAAFGIYYTLADLVAVRAGTWFFDEKQITGVKLGGVLPWEEIAFFFLTSLLVAQSYLLLLPAICGEVSDRTYRRRSAINSLMVESSNPTLSMFQSLSVASVGLFDALNCEYQVISNPDRLHIRTLCRKALFQMQWAAVAVNWQHLTPTAISPTAIEVYRFIAGSLLAIAI